MRLLAVIAEPVTRPADARRIAAVRRRFDPRFAAVPAHVTLVFPVAAAGAEAAMRAVGAVARRAAAVAATLAGADPFRPAGARRWLVMLRVARGGGALARLHHRLDAGPFRGNRRGTAPFRPHLTVAAGLTAPAAARLARHLCRAPPIACRFRALDLVAWDGRRLERLGRVALGRGTPQSPSLMPFSR